MRVAVGFALLGGAPPLAGQDTTVESRVVQRIGIYQQVYASRAAGEPVALAPRVFVDGFRYANRTAGLWGFAYGERDYESGTLGLYDDLVSIHGATLEAGLGAGLAIAQDGAGSAGYPRFAGLLVLGTEDKSIDLYHELGPRRASWTQWTATWQFTEPVAVGVLSQTGDGFGPRILVSVPRTTLRAWGGPMFTRSSVNALFGVEVLFDRKAETKPPS